MASELINFLSIESVCYSPLSTLPILEICNSPRWGLVRAMLSHSPLYLQHLKLALHMKDATLVELRKDNLSSEKFTSEYAEGNEMPFLLCPQIAPLSPFLSS